MKNYAELIDLSKKLSDPRQAESDMKEAAGLVLGMLRDKYISRMNKALAKIQEQAREAPSKEVTLLRSLKPFLRNDAHEHLDRVTELFLFADTFSRLREASAASAASEASNAAPASGKDIIHSDGVYAIDQECLENQA